MIKHVTPLAILLLLTFYVHSHAQHINGKVLDTETGDPIPYVHVSLGDQAGTVTDTFGNFNLELTQPAEIKFSCIGYITYYHKINTAADTSLSIHLIPDAQLLPEILVYSSKINLLERPKRVPLKITGLPSLDNPQPVKFGSWAWDPSMAFESRIGGHINGPFSYFSALEKEKRKLEEVSTIENQMEAYHGALYNHDFKQQMLKALHMDAEEYDSLIILFNQQHTYLVANKSKDEASTLLFLFFQDQLKE